MILFFYRILINFTLIFSPLIIIYRILKNKEHPLRFKEKLGLSSDKRISGKLIWLHGSSVGEILSVVPLIEKLEKKKNIKQILLTSSTLSSSKIISKLKLNKTIHQFYPIDVNFITNNFLSYWKPNIAIFIESEIWPNMILNIKKKNIPLVLLNARITKKSFKKWKSILNFSKNIFNKFNLCLAQNNETRKYLFKLGAKNIKKIGNLKFSERRLKSKIKINNSKKIFFKSKKVLFCAVSTHQTEEIFCAKVYKKLLKKNKNSIAIIIPRHINRSNEIINSLEKLNLNIHRHSSNQKINRNINIYLVDTYGETEFFQEISKIVFLGGSLIYHGGQNPLEAARLGCTVLHGPNISNFYEVYDLLNKINISIKIKSVYQMKNIINKNLKYNLSSRKMQKKLKFIGDQILINNQIELEKYF